MFRFDLIDEYQIEITTYCNAACPQCPRNTNGGAVNSYLPLRHLDRDLINNRFTPDLCARLRQIFFCGSYGDPIMHPDFLGILEDFRSKRADLWLYIHTNGGAHDPDYWTKIGRIMGPYGQIDFGIDGLQHTLGMYRRHVDFQKVMTNAAAFIAAGGRAQWNFIVFKHNQHEVEAARQLSQRMGFATFLPRKTGRFFHHEREEEIKSWPVMHRSGKIQYHLEPPDLPEWRNSSVDRLPELKTTYKDLTHYWNITPIRCDAAQGRKVAVTAEGLVLPCNFFNHNLYDARFHDQQVLPGRNRLHDRDGTNQVRQFLESYGLDQLDLHEHTLEEVFQCTMWRDLVASWSKDLDHGRLFECAMTCGEKFTKVWDQGGSKR